jgi:hypothetical protein
VTHTSGLSASRTREAFGPRRPRRGKAPRSAREARCRVARRAAERARGTFALEHSDHRSLCGSGGPQCDQDCKSESEHSPPKISNGNFFGTRISFFFCRLILKTVLFDVSTPTNPTPITQLLPKFVSGIASVKNHVVVVFSFLTIFLKMVTADGAWENPAERERFEAQAAVFSIVRTVEALERAYVQDHISAAEFECFCCVKIAPFFSCPCLLTFFFGGQFFFFFFFVFFFFFFCVCVCRYTPACAKLISQFKTARRVIENDVPDIEAFMTAHGVACPAATHRWGGHLFVFSVAVVAHTISFLSPHE